MSDRYQLNQYLPELYRESPLEELLATMGDALRRAANDLDGTLLQLFPATASSWGLELWERAYGITVDPTKTLEERRAAILSKVRGQGVPTVQLIQSVAQAYAQGPVEVVEQPGEYRFAVAFIPDPARLVDAAALISALNEVKPAHLAMDVAPTAASTITITGGFGHESAWVRRCGQPHGTLF